MAHAIIAMLSKLVRAEKRDANGYRAGYIFGQEPLSENIRIYRVKINAKMERVERGNSFVSWTGRRKCFPYNVWDTPLREYTFKREQKQADGCRFDFEGYLFGKAQEAVREGRMLRVLDVGVGSGKQWLEFLHSHKIDFHATALWRKRVVEELAGRVVECNAAQLHEKFARGFFDVVVSHYGMNHQTFSAIENAVWVLKEGGELVASGEGEDDGVLSRCLCECRASGVFETLGNAIEENGHWFIHMRKLPLQQLLR